MNRYLIICAMLLTACDERIVTVYAVPYVPDDLRQHQPAVCPRGYTGEVMATCLFRKDAGEAAAIQKIKAIDEILTQAEKQSQQ